MNNDKMVQLAVNTIRTLSIDAVQAAKSGHPGTPMALAPLVYTIWNRAMNFDPQHPIWPNRDRFVLSNGHASMLLWSILHLTKVQAVNADYEELGKPSVSLEDIRRFRQLDSKAPGHPEYHWVSGVETTTGPLGQGVATSVGMAIAQKWLANRYNKPGFDIFDYNIYAICGDGCMMEGIASEAASLAGHLGLDNLCWVWDNNHITIEGNTSITFTEDVAARFLAYGWNVLRVGDANDIERIDNALAVFRRTQGRPTFIVLDSHIGYGSPHKQDTSAATANPSARKKSNSPSVITIGRKTRSFSCRTACTTTLLPASVSAARRPSRTGRNFSQRIALSIRTWRRKLTRYSAENCRTVGIAISRRSQRIRKEWLGARHLARR
jgi:transketolase